MVIYSTESSFWFHKDAPHLGFSNVISKLIAQTSQRYPGSIPNLQGAKTLLLGSDCAGLHKGARFEVISMIVCNPEQLGYWEQRRSEFRERLLDDKRRMSYKSLSDRKRQNALSFFLEAANHINGLLINVAVDRRIKSLFEASDPLKREPPGIFVDWKTTPTERALRIIHLVSLVLRGLNCDGPDLLWITDEDEIVANENRLRTFVQAFATVSSHYLVHSMGHLKIGTTKSDTGKCDVEDYVAICDFAAGALQEALSNGGLDGIVQAPSLFFPRPIGLKSKAAKVMDWLADNSQSLKRLGFIIDEAPTTGQLRATNFRAHGTNDLQ